MYVIRTRNVHEALPEAVSLMVREGRLTTCRNGDVLVVSEPVTTIYERPCERVLFWPERDANPFFHFYEALWMLGGRNDVASLTRFVKRMSEFSDDGLIFHGAYGHRWWRHFGMPQPLLIGQTLRDDPTDRRQVLQIWDGCVDLPEQQGKRDLPCNLVAHFQIHDALLDMTVFCRSNDIIWGCLTADTPILSPEGTISIEQLAMKFQHGLKRYPVYSVAVGTGCVSLQYCTRAWRSGTKPVLELTFDDGSALRLTVDHRLYKRKWKSLSDQTITEVCAGDLVVGDRVWAPRPYRKADGRWYFKSSLFNHNRRASKVAVAYATLLYGPIPKGHVVHHKNGQRWDDRAENLEVKTKGEHQSDHLSVRNPGFEKVNAGMSCSERARRGRLGNVSRWKDPFQHAKQREVMKELQRAGRINHKIVAIRQLAPEPVYDLTVENTHTALVGTGVLVHNCYGANAVHFSMLQEFIAAVAGVAVGRYYHVSDNWHAYPETFAKVSVLAEQRREPPDAGPLNPYADDVAWYPLICSDVTTWLSDLQMFLDEEGRALGYRDRFFRHVALPMMKAHRCYKNTVDPLRFEHALEAADAIRAADWQRAAIEWLQRREREVADGQTRSHT